MEIKRFNREIEKVNSIYHQLNYYFKGMDFDQSIIDSYFNCDTESMEAYNRLNEEIDVNVNKLYSKGEKTLTAYLKKVYVEGFFFWQSRFGWLKEGALEKSTLEVLREDDNYSKLNSIIQSLGMNKSSLKTLLKLDYGLEIPKLDEDKFSLGTHTYYGDFVLKKYLKEVENALKLKKTASNKNETEEQKSIRINEMQYIADNNRGGLVFGFRDALIKRDGRILSETEPLLRCFLELHSKHFEAYPCVFNDLEQIISLDYFKERNKEYGSYTEIKVLIEKILSKRIERDKLKKRNLIPKNILDILENDSLQLWRKESLDFAPEWYYYEPISLSILDRWDYDKRDYYKYHFESNLIDENEIPFSEINVAKELITCFEKAKHPYWIQYVEFLTNQINVIKNDLNIKEVTDKPKKKLNKSGRKPKETPLFTTLIKDQYEFKDEEFKTRFTSYTGNKLGLLLKELESNYIKPLNDARLLLKSHLDFLGLNYTDTLYDGMIKYYNGTLTVQNQSIENQIKEELKAVFLIKNKVK